MIIHVPRTWSIWDVLRSWEVRRPKKQLKGSWVAGTLVEQGQAILLCALCKHNFNYKQHHYDAVSQRDCFYACGECDACGDSGDNLFLYLPEQNVSKVMVTRDERKAMHKQRYGGQ